MSIKLLKIKRQEKSDDAAKQQQQAAAGTGQQQQSDSPRTTKFEAPLVWRNIILFVILHSSIPVGFFLIADPETRPQWRTVLWMTISAYASGIGVTAGAHRLWSHKAYKVRLPLEMFLMVLQTMSGQNSIYTWSRDHRVHHKFSETDADPHNIKRGFFFAHMGWLCCRKHPAVAEKGALIDMSDLEANPLVMFQHRNFGWLALLFMAVLPTAIPVVFWQERVWTAFIFCTMIRYLGSLHATWLVNSAAHQHGSRPYDKDIEARESPWVILFGLGEGFHNYHHTFPFDYSTSEFGKLFNTTTAFIDMFASLGLAYDLRKMDKKIIESRRMRTGEHKRSSATAKGVDDAPPLVKSSDSMDVRDELGKPFSMDYISGPTSLNYTM